MYERQFIKTILPLRLEWEPWYYADFPVYPGKRVLATLAGKQYVGVVCEVSGEARLSRCGGNESPQQVLEAVDCGYCDILPCELDFWEFISSYYMCTLGEVYKYVYPDARLAAENKKPTLREWRQESLVRFEASRPLLLKGRADGRTVRDMCSEVLRSGRDVLVIKPDMRKESYPRIRDLAAIASSYDKEPCIISGSRWCLFLPFVKLGLVVVEDEESENLKQDGIAPRFNGRDAAVALAGIHKASVVLTSRAPSLESMLNCISGKYELRDESAKEDNFAGYELIDTVAESRKNGMSGSFSKVFLIKACEVLESGGRLLVLAPWKDTRDIEIDLRGHFPKARTKIVVETLNLSGAALKEQLASCRKYALTLLLRAEYLTGKNDFRADEKSIRLLGKLNEACCRLLVQTSESKHPVFSGAIDYKSILSERKAAGYPPYTRLVEIKSSRDRKTVRQFLLPKDRNLEKKKQEILSSLPRGCYADVDPL